MKNFILLFAIVLSINTAFAYNYNSEIINNAVNEDHRLEYNQTKKTWVKTNSETPETFTKHWTKGSGGFSEYERNKNMLETCTTYEFLYKNQLIGYNTHTLKFYKFDFENEKFNKTELSESQIKELFPDVEIVKISQFKDNKITLNKPWFKKKTFLIVNDTDKEFYKYQFEHYAKTDELIRELIEVDRPRTFIFSHFGSRDKLFPTLKITVKNK